MSTGAYFAFDIFGWKELDEALLQISDIATQKRVLVNAMKKALKPVAEDARQRVPVDEGDLRDSIVVSTAITRRQGRGIVRGVPRVYVGTNNGSGHLIEFGTGPRKSQATKKQVLAAGGVVFGTTANANALPARPFIRPAFDSNREKVLEIFGREMWKNLERTAKRLFKQATSGKLSKGGKRALGVG